MRDSTHYLRNRTDRPEGTKNRDFGLSVVWILLRMPDPGGDASNHEFMDLECSDKDQGGTAIGQCMIAIAIIGYFCAFPELAVLLGILVSALLFVSPVFVVQYLALRFLLRSHRPASPRL